MMWKRIPFGEFTEIQPQVKLEKGTAYSFIEMADVKPHTKSVMPSTIRIWRGSGGAKFKNGDVVYARITPCLEHGKTAKVMNLPESMGFGSTEFFVFRCREGVSNPDYIYYIACSPVIREPAIKSMVGASGRQRAQKTVVENTIICVPDIKEQQRIASILSAYDDLIENNRRRIQLLEQAARLLYKEWFVHLRYPGHDHAAQQPTGTTELHPEGTSANDSANPHANIKTSPAHRPGDNLPEGWVEGVVSDFYSTASGGTPSRKNPDFYTGIVPWVKTQELTGGFIMSTEEKITEEAIKLSSAKLLPRHTVLVAMYGATIGQTAILSVPATTNQACCAVLPAAPGTSYVHAYLFFNHYKTDLVGLGQGAAQKNVSQRVIKAFRMVLPAKGLLDEFSETVCPLFDQIEILQRTNINLTKARDLLLPRLMNGEVEV